MSFTRMNRGFASHGGSKKLPKTKRRKASAKQDWDCTVSDLTVHRATPEDLVRRHELHKSKNRWLAQWELREKTLKKRLKKQRLELPDAMEKKRLAIMKEVLFDHYQLQDVLERSDQAVGAVKDLFGDAPARRTGFPNITVAPSCDLNTSRGPIAQQREFPTQLSILSESVMDSQALNEVDNSSLITPSELSYDVRDVSLGIHSSVGADRMFRLLKEENSLLESQLWEDSRSQIPARAPVTSPATPSTPAALLSLEQTAALNATTAVQRARSWLQVAEHEESSGSPSVGQVLNPRPKNVKLAGIQGNRKCSQVPSFRSLSDMTSMTPTSHSRSSLEVLNHMIKEVEREMADYEHQTGRTVTSSQGRDGITGFTLSLVNSLSRLVRYLKEGEMHLKREMEDRRRLEEELGDHQILIDALTAEILSLREENTSNQTKLQMYTMATDEQLISLTRALKNLSTIGPNGFQCQQDPNGSTILEEASVQELPATDALVARTSVMKGPDEIKVFLGQEPVKPHQKPVQPQQKPILPKAPKRGGSLPTHLFEPAVLLSPPRQKSNQDVWKRDIQAHPKLCTIQPSENKEALVYQEMKSSPGTAEIETDDHRLNAHRWDFTHAKEGMENTSVTPLFNSLSSTQVPNSSCCVDGPDTAEGVPSKGDGKSLPSAEKMHDDDLVAKIAELTMQNSVLKAQLTKCKVDTHVPEAGEGQLQSFIAKEANKTAHSQASCTESKEVYLKTPEIIPAEVSLEHRIAELNRQSAEARNKLLQLIDQQKHTAAASPPISPIPLQPTWTGSKGKTIEVSIPGHELADSSTGQTPSPTSMASISGRSSSSRTNRSYSPQTPRSARTPVGLKPMVKNHGEEGWFALSTHVM